MVGDTGFAPQARQGEALSVTSGLWYVKPVVILVFTRTYKM